MSVQISGIGVSRGIAIGKAHILQRGELEILEYAIPEQYIRDEIQRFRRALEVARGQLREIRGRIPPDTRPDIIEFIDTHLLMLEDSTLTVAPEQLIESQRINAEWALKLQRDALVEVFEQIDDAYLRTRKDDIDHVVNRIQRILLSEGEPQETPPDSHLQGAVVLADDLSPADIVLMHHQGVIGFVTEHGGPLSHTTIIARSLHIPAVAGAHKVRRYIQDGETVIVDGERGLIIAGPDAAMLAYYRERRREVEQYRAALERLRGRAAVTRDGRAVELLGNIELAGDIAEVLAAEADGVGLYRTEFLYMNRSDLPDEEEQLAAYAEVVRALEGRPLTIRTLDLGADKTLDGGEDAATNPALGLRAVRLCLRDPALFRPQLRAILRTSALGPVRLMIPMISSIQEVRQVRALIRLLQDELDAEGRAFDPAMPVGGMIEVPAAAVAAELFARELDFLSIGTNDLIQYTLAIDRVDDEVNYLYDPAHPAVLQLLHRVIGAGKEAGTPVAMCGEMAGDPCYTRLLLGLGLRQFSMQANAILEVKQVIVDNDTRELEPLIAELLHCHDFSHYQRLLGRLVTSPLAS